jgi:2-polyprenyl-6-methoxyphenol hydroxylase-like FAD-dependent oxidoreductase
MAASPLPSHTPVLIIGAGLAGLTAATLLAWRGVPCLLVERRASTARHPRARGLNMRSMELLRGVPGLEADLRRTSPRQVRSNSAISALSSPRASPAASSALSSRLARSIRARCRRPRNAWPGRTASSRSCCVMLWR